jgi:HNH endonuclease
MLTQERLRELLVYDPLTGVFVWKVKRKQMNPGDEAGRLDTKGHRQITVDNKRYLAHRLVWLYVHGTFPENQLDHRDQNKENNRIENLREASNAQNQQNRGPNKNNKLGCKGVHRHRSGKFVATLRADGQSIYLGIFELKDDAVAAHSLAEKEYFGEFARLS